MERKIADCRRWPSEIDCSLTIIGTEEEVVEAAARHAASAHGHEDTPDLRRQIREMLEPEASYQMGERLKESRPGN